MNEIAVILVHWKDRNQTKICLEKVLTWSRIKPIIYLVQNEQSEDQFAEYTGINSILSERNLGYGGGNNLGLKQAIHQARYSLLLNTDASIDEAEVELLIETMKSNATIFSTGPVLEEYSEDNARLYYGGRDIATHLNTRMEVDDAGIISKSPVWIKVDYTIGTILLLDNRKLESVGLFDTDYFFSGEVADLCYRASRAGYLPTTSINAVGKHMLDNVNKRNTMYKYYNLRNRGLYIVKHKLGFNKLASWWIYAAKDTLYFVLKGRRQEAKSSYLALIHMILGSYGNKNKEFQ